MSPVGYRLTTIRRILSTEETVATVDGREHEFYFTEKVCCPLRRHIFDFGCAEAPKDVVCHNHKANIVLLLVGICRLHQLVLVLLADSEKRTRRLTNLSGERPILHAAVVWRMGRQNRNLLAGQVFIDEINGSVGDVPVLYCPGCDVRSMSGKSSARRIVICAATDMHCARIQGMKATDMHFA